MKTLTCIIVTLTLFVSTAFTQADNQIIVQLHPNHEVKDLVDTYQFYKGQNTGLYSKTLISKQLNIWLLEFDPQKADVREVVAVVRENPTVQAAQLNHPVELRTSPNDPEYTAQWQYDNDGLEGRLSDADIDAPLAWDITTGGTTITGDEIVVGVIDNGVDLTHPDLINNMWTNPYETLNGIDDDGNGYIDDIHGWNFREDFNNNDIGNAGAGGGHGTSVMGIIAAEGNNGIGTTGINWNVKVMNFVRNGSDASILAAYAYMLDMRTRYNQSNGTDGAFIVVTNASLGREPRGTEEDQIWCSMYDALGEAGIISAGATDNAHINVDEVGDLPSGCPSEYLITVTNTDYRDKKIYGSGYGLLSVDLSAPGQGTITTENLGDIRTFCCTSAATPHVAGAIALLYSAPIPEFMDDVRQNPREAGRRVKNFILQGVDKLPDLEGITLTGGRLNVYNSLVEMQDYYDIPQETLLKDSITLSTIFPNPTKDIVEVEIKLYETTFLKIKVLNLLGQSVYNQSFGKADRGVHHKTLSLKSLPAGTYFIMAVAESFGTMSTQKIVVEN